MKRIAEFRKFLTALTGGAAVAVSAGLLNGAVEKWTTGVLAVLTAVVVGLVPNAPPQ